LVLQPCYRAQSVTAVALNKIGLAPGMFRPGRRLFGQSQPEPLIFGPQIGLCAQLVPKAHAPEALITLTHDQANASSNAYAQLLWAPVLVAIAGALRFARQGRGGADEMAATKFEFEWRFWIIAAIFWAAFALYAVDHRWVAMFFLHLLAPSVPAMGSRAMLFDRAVLFAGVALVFSAALFRTWATAYLGTDIMSDTKLHSDALAADGPYRHTRNPLYFANLPLALGVGIFANPTGLLFLCAAMVVFVYRLIFREEANLRQTLGPAYLRYTETVPRFWPSLRPRWPATGHAPRWGQAFVGELLLWLIGITLFTFVLTFNQTLLYGGIAASFAISLGLRSVGRKWSAATWQNAS
jgi:protein-S-isoprenylcysteine O-methyltransferase Ste14